MQHPSSCGVIISPLIVAFQQSHQSLRRPRRPSPSPSRLRAVHSSTRPCLRAKCSRRRRRRNERRLRIEGEKRKERGPREKNSPPGWCCMMPALGRYFYEVSSIRYFTFLLASFVDLLFYIMITPSVKTTRYPSAFQYKTAAAEVSQSQSSAGPEAAAAAGRTPQPHRVRLRRRGGRVRLRDGRLHRRRRRRRRLGRNPEDHGVRPQEVRRRGRQLRRHGSWVQRGGSLSCIDCRSTMIYIKSFLVLLYSTEKKQISSRLVDFCVD